MSVDEFADGLDEGGGLEGLLQNPVIGRIRGIGRQEQNSLRQLGNGAAAGRASEYNEVGRLFVAGNKPCRMLAVAGLEHSISRAAQNDTDQVAKLLVLFDDEHCVAAMIEHGADKKARLRLPGVDRPGALTFAISPAGDCGRAATWFL
jgi:hypothetical protein